jgi:hypothetical protein
MGSVLTLRVQGACGGLIKGERGNRLSLLSFDHETASSLPVDLGVIKEMDER